MCCCETGETKTETTCPSGWTLFDGVCQRSDTSTGSDSTGSYTISYTSCEPEQNIFDCYEVCFGTTCKNYLGLDCYCKATN